MSAVYVILRDWTHRGGFFGPRNLSNAARGREIPRRNSVSRFFSGRPAEVSRNAGFRVRGPPLAPKSREIAHRTRSFIALSAVGVRNPSAEAVGAKLGRPRLLEIPARTAEVSRHAPFRVRGPALAPISREFAPGTRSSIVCSAVGVRNPSAETVGAKLGRPWLLENPARTAGASRNPRLYVYEPPSGPKNSPRCV